MIKNVKIKPGLKIQIGFKQGYLYPKRQIRVIERHIGDDALDGFLEE